MSYRTVTYNSLSAVDKEKFYLFCKEASINQTHPAAKNMWDNNWDNNPSTLPYILEIEQRFSGSNGEFFILFFNNNIVGCSGIYKSQFDKNIGIAGVRTWIADSYRNNSINREYLLPTQKQWAKDNNCKIVALTFNEYNKNIIQIFKRKRLGEIRDRINSREPFHLFYSGLEEVDFPVTIQYTKQWVIYEKLDPTWNYNWSTIKWK
jgi:hypothetical protein